MATKLVEQARTPATGQRHIEPSILQFCERCGRERRFGYRQMLRDAEGRREWEAYQCEVCGRWYLVCVR